jgi:uncharacterized protein involved in exopolysaccharide biosynthesis
MSDGTKEPNNAELLSALQGMWRQQKDFVHGVETRLGSKLDAVAEKLDHRLAAAEVHLGERLAREIQDRPVVVHVDMSRITELEKQLAELVKRVADLEARSSNH